MNPFLGSIPACLVLLGANVSAQEVSLRIPQGPPADSLRPAGDVDGDGVPDLLWGGALTPAGSPDTRVVSGATGQVLHDIEGDSYHGASNGAGGDLDADGFDDFLVGDAIGLLATPRAYSGATGEVLFEFPSPACCTKAGAGLAIVPDLDGDGHDEMAIASPFEDHPRGKGLIRLRSGRDGSVLLELEAVRGQDHFGIELALAGDQDGDGRADLIAGVLEGPITVFSLVTGEELRVFSNPSGDDEYGTQVGTLGDADGDGIADLFIAGPEESAWKSQVGRVSVFRGSDGSELWTLQGEQPGDFFATAVDAVGDLDGDGVDELAIGVPLDKWGAAGSASCPLGHVLVVSGADGAELLRIEGADLGGCVGRRLAAPGDVNGDGTPDLALATRDEVLLVSLGPLALSAGLHALSLSQGGVQELALEAGPAHAGDAYLVVGSMSGIAPGFDFRGVHVPLNPDPYLSFSFGASRAGTTPFAATSGTLDPSGRATARLEVPAGSPAALAGLALHHAFGVFDGTSGRLELASNAVPLILEP